MTSTSRVKAQKTRVSAQRRKTEDAKAATYKPAL